MPRLYIVIPVYNEQATLLECVSRVEAAALRPEWERRLVFIDDASTDDTPALLRSFAERHTIRTQPRNRGKGAAIRTGFAAVLGESAEADAVIVQDADLEYNPADYERLLEPIVQGRSRIVFGTRFGPHYEPATFRLRLHALGNRLLTELSNWRTGLHLTDMECGYKVFAAPVLAHILPMLREDRFGIEPEITAAAAAINERIEEVPVSYHPRSVGEGKKIKWSDGMAALRVIRRGTRRDAEHGS
ncbi:MAG: glycosyltransferase family 2 protein [Phycisphaerales bacterium]|nr:glycosyltransferase family 2 protein [Phycisphaerales bacterium]